MGWISDRHMQNGGSIGGMKGMKHRGPLRKIVRVLLHSSSIFESESVELECGHTCYRATLGATRARCSECAKTDPAWLAKHPVN